MNQIRKVLLSLAGAIMLTACAAPTAQAEGPFWHVGGEKVEGSVPFSTSGKLTFKDPLTESLTFTVGPCSMHFTGTLENGEETAEGSVESFSIFSGCSTNVPGCSAAVFPLSPPWSMAVAEGAVSWLGTSFVGTFTGCAAIGIPNNTPIPWGGPLNGQWNNETGCLEYENAGELFAPGAEDSVFTDGELCLSTKGGSITLE